MFVPLAAAAFVLTMWRDTWRRGYASLVAAGAAAGATGAVLAAQSGEALEETLRRTAPTRPRFGEHPEQGDTAEILAVVFAIIAITVWALDRWGAPPRIQRAAYVVGTLVAVAATATMVIVGDSGARLVWEQLGTFVSPH